MLVRDGRGVRHDLGPAPRWSFSGDSIGSGKGSHAGEPYRAIADRISASGKARREQRVVSAPVVLRVACPGPCKGVFTTTNPRRVWCSARCLDRHRRRINRAPRVRREEVFATCEHVERPMVARGMCHTCYMREWRAARRSS